MRSDADLGVDPLNPVGGLFSLEDTDAFSHSGHERNHLFMNLGSSRYADISGVSGLDDPADGRAWALVDFNLDGWQDIAVVNANTPLLRLYENRLGEDPANRASGNFIAIRFVGGNWDGSAKQGLACRDGYGARARVRIAETQLLREHRCGEGLAAQNSATLVVGIGANDHAEEVTIEWPSGRSATRQRIPSGTLVTVFEDAAQSPNGEEFVLSKYGRPGIRLAGKPGSATGSQRIRLRNGPATTAKLNLYTTMATWCPKCKGELPQIAKLRQGFGPEDLALLGVPIDPEDSPEKLDRYVAEYRPSYELLSTLPRREIEMVEETAKNTLEMEEVLPATLVTDDSGNILMARAGVPTVSELKKLLRASSR